jgi:serine/threonine protein kinase
VITLRKLYVEGNPLNFRVSRTIFEGIAKLEVFTSDILDASVNCDGGEWNTTHGVKFCVMTGASSAGVSSAETSDESTSYLVYVAIGGGVVALVLLFFVVREKWWHAIEKSCKDDSQSIFAETYDFDKSASTLDVNLITDPMVLTNRIPYAEVKLGKCISQGGFGLVFVGSYHGRKVAVKKIRPELCDNLEQIEQFVKEIALMAMLVHPRIVEFVGVAWDSLRHLSAVTEFMERGDLRDVLQGFKVRGCRLTWANHKTQIALHIAEALTYLHSLRPKKVIHRDLKSKNVLMNADMEAKLSDFGISRERRFEETHMTAGIGTSFWIAPEVLLGKDYDERADIFSFGVVLCEIDTDDYPYWNEKNPVCGGQLQQAEILRQVASGALRPTFSEDCPKAILDLADSCLQADPTHRPTASEIEYELQRLVRDSYSNSEPSGSESSERVEHL